MESRLEDPFRDRGRDLGGRDRMIARQLRDWRLAANDGGPPCRQVRQRGGRSRRARLAADFKLQDLEGNTISLSSLRGKVVFLNVWATWCGPCREEMPSIESLYEEFSNDKDFVVLAVSQDSGDGKQCRRSVRAAETALSSPFCSIRTTRSARPTMSAEFRKHS